MKRRLGGIFLTFCMAAAFALSAAAWEYDATEETLIGSVSEALAGEPESEGAILAGDIIASGECGADGDNVTWTLDSEGTLIISGTGKMKSYGLYVYAPWKTYQEEISTVLIQYSVTSIGSYAFSGCHNLTSTTIPISVTSIESYAFSNCYNLISITIPDNVTSIGNGAFYGCSVLTSVTIPDSVTSIGTGLFYRCNALISVTIPDSVISIEYDTFRDCSSLTSITIPNSVTSIGKNAFEGCDSLTNVTIPDSVTSIGNNAFGSCDNLKSVKISENVTSIGDYTFQGCNNLTSVTIPDGVTSIGCKAFEDCDNLTSVTISNSVISIGDGAFWQCRRLTSVTIPNSVTSIEGGTFAACYKLTNITVENGNPAYSSSNGILFSKNQKRLITYPAGKIGAYNIPDSVTSVGNDAFLGCSGLTSVTIPDSVTSIGSGAFFSCSGLTRVTIPNSVTSIGNQAFQGCSNLASVTIPDSVTSIGDYAFTSCKNLTSATIPHSVTSIADWVFASCDNLTSVIIPDNVTSIGKGSFDSCKNLASVTIPDSVTSIGERAFAYCYHLRDVYYAGSEEQWKKIDGSDIVFKGMGAVIGVVIHYNSSSDISDDEFLFIAANSASEKIYDEDIGTWYREYAAVGNGYITTVMIKEGITLPCTKNGVGDSAVANGYTKACFSTILGRDSQFNSNDILVSASVYASAYYARGIRRVNSEEVRVNTSQSDNTTLLDVAENVRVYFVDGDEIEEIYYDEIVNDTQDCVFYILADEEVTHLFICDDGGDAEPDVLIKDGEFLYVSRVTDLERPSLLAASESPVAVKKLYSYSYDERWFFEDASVYQHGLAKMSIRMAMAAYGMKGTAYKNGASRVDGNTTVSYLADEDSESTSEGIVLLMKNLQFTDVQVCYPKPGMDTIGYAIGSKRIANGDGTYTTLIAVAVRGGGYKQEWASNFTVGTASEHSGFARSANTVSQAVRNYITGSGARENLKVWVTGYSRGAAVANMTAQRLTYQANNGAVRGLTADNIFAYCFECPRMVTTDSPSYEAVVYDNIFNIVNEIDLVPKVAPEAWNFGRYGITYYVPSAEQTRNFATSYGDLQRQYSNILKYNSVKYNGAEGRRALDEMSSHYTAYFPGQGTILTDTIKTVGNALDSQSVYSNGYEDLVQRAVLKKYEKGDILSSGQIFSLVYETISRHWPPIVKESINIAKIVSKQILTQINYAHYPELCLAWMDSIDGESGYCMDARTRMLLVNCPVNVSVYDSSGALVAQIVDDNAVEIDGSMIAAYIDENGQKVVLLPTDEEYQIEVTATDNGTMSYQIEEMDVDSGAAARLVSYYDVPVSTGESFTGTAENLREDSEARYQLMGADNQAITPTVDVSENIDEYLISVSVEGHGTVSGAGNYVVGEYVRLTARADSGEAFLGWYQDETLISTDLEYRFRVEDNQSLVAKFSDLHYKIQDISASDNVMTVSVTGRAVLPGIVLAALYTQDRQLVSVFSANITQAGEIPVRLTERKNAEIVTVFIFSNDNERKPLCQCLTQSLDFLP